MFQDIDLIQIKNSLINSQKRATCTVHSCDRVSLVPPTFHRLRYSLFSEVRALPSRRIIHPCNFDQNMYVCSHLLSLHNIERERV